MSNEIFNSFWMAGFECTDKLNAFGHRVDFLELTGHLQLLDYDYQLLSQFNIKTVREGIRWSQVEKRPYDYDWSVVEHMINTARKHDIQQIWDLCHFGFPDDITPVHPMFARRFAALCRAFVQFYRAVDPNGTLIITPINEVSFLSWLGGDARGTSPYCINMGWEVKYMLMKAYIEGVAAIKEIDNNIKILTTEPLVNIVAPVNASDEDRHHAAMAHNHQFQSVDILCGRLCPELGGKPEYIDFLGYNFYYNNQYALNYSELIPWRNDDSDPRWLPLSQLLSDCYKRYNCPIVLTETSHSGEDRPLWIKFIAEQCKLTLEQNVPLLGVCIYPIIDRPDWDHLSPWHNSGLWDAEFVENEPPKRVLYQPYADALIEAQELVSDFIQEPAIKKDMFTALPPSSANIACTLS